MEVVHVWTTPAGTQALMKNVQMNFSGHLNKSLKTNIPDSTEEYEHVPPDNFNTGLWTMSWALKKKEKKE